MRKKLWSAVIIAGYLCFPAVCAAGIDFGPVAPFSPTAATDGTAIDVEPTVASDGNGKWVVIWRSTNAAFGFTGGNGTPVVSRSSDDGATWTAPTLVRPEFAAFDTGALPAVATDTHGKWILVWGHNSYELSYTISLDDGATWGVPSTLAASLESGMHSHPTIDTDRAGTWVVAWDTNDTLGGTIGGDYDILFSRSTDEGASWSAPSILNTTAAVDAVSDYDVRISTDRSGTWVAVWSGSLSARYSRSTDNGATWSAPAELSHNGGGTGTSPDIGTDGTGRWIAVWGNDLATFGDDYDLWTSVSSDNGATWSPESRLGSYMDLDKGGDFDPRLLSLGDGRWSVVWTSTDSLHGMTGEELDIEISSSRDGGLTWSSPALVVNRSRKDDAEADDLRPVAASSPLGRMLVLWDSYDSLAGTIGTDPDILFGSASRDCAPIAREDCRVPTRARGSSMRIKDAVGGNDRLKWRWRYGQETTDADLGDPTSTDSYVLCLYEKVGSDPGLISEWDMRAGQTCAGVPCWTQVAGEVSYADAGLEQGSIKSLRITAGADGEASIRLMGSGPALAPPRLPLSTSPAVRLQLVNLGTGACWDATHAEATRNDTSQYKSVSN